MNMDAEIVAMTLVYEALEPLDAVARVRVVDWARERYAKMTTAEMLLVLAKELEEVRTERDTAVAARDGAPQP